jgi:hypothetical protein
MRGQQQTCLWFLAVERIGALAQDILGGELTVEFISLPHGHS